MTSELLDQFTDAFYGRFPLDKASLFTYSQRDLFACALGKLVVDNVRTVGLPDYSDSRYQYLTKSVTGLKENGIFVIPGFLDKSVSAVIAEVVAGLQTGYAGHVPSLSNYTEIPVNSFEAENAKHFCYPVSKILSLCPLLTSVITSKLLLSVATNYLGCPPTFYSINAYKSRARMGMSPGVTTPHRDYDDFRFLTCFLYLTDVDESSGAFMYWPGSHITDSIATNKPLEVVGPAGTLVLCDTWGLHMGLPPISNDRIAIWWRFGLGKNFAYWWDKNYLLNLGNALGESLGSSILQYVFRGVL